MGIPTVSQLHRKPVQRKTFHLTRSVDIDTKSIRCSDARWEHEVGDGGIKGKFDNFVDSMALEVVVTTCVVADLSLTVLTFVASEEVSESEIVFILSAIFLFVLIVDVILRAIKDGFKFCRRWLNWLEVFVAVASAVMLTLDGIRRTCSGSGCSEGGQTKGASLGRAVRPLLRMIRVARAASHLLLNRGGVVGKVDRLADKLVDEKVRKLIDKFLLCPADNIMSKPSKGQFHFEKAQIRSRVFENVHLPFTILGGLIDLVHFDVDLVKGRRHNTDDKQHRLLVIVENAVLVVGPGHHQEEPAPVWTYEAVLERKDNIVNFIIGQAENVGQLFPKQAKEKRVRRSSRWSVANSQASTLEASTSDKSTAASNQSRPSVQSKEKNIVKNRAAERLKKRFLQVVEEVLANGMHVSLRNIEIRYEDGQGELTPGKQVVGGFEIGSVQIRAQGVSDERQQNAEEVDFRVKGKWRPGVAVDFHEPIMSEATKESLTASKNTTATKRSLRNGIRAAMHINRFAAFWNVNDICEAEPGTVLYAPFLRENTSSNIARFLKDCRARRARERARWAISGEVEKRLRLTGKCIEERIRRLRDKVSAHRYLLIPCSCSVHGVYRPRTSTGTFATTQDPDIDDAEREVKHATREVEEMIDSIRKKDKQKARELEMKFRSLLAQSDSMALQGFNDFWPPQTDIDVHIPRIPFTVDVLQARSLVELSGYLKRWFDEDNRIMWQTMFLGVANFSPKQITSFRWGYALRQVLHGIDSKYPWKQLPWWEMMRQAKFRQKYLDALIEAEPNEEKISRLQVALPLMEIFFCRRASLLTTDDRRKKRERAARQKARNSAVWSLSSSHDSKASASVDLEMGVTDSYLSQSMAPVDSMDSSVFTGGLSNESELQESIELVKSNYKQAHEDLKDLEDIQVPSSAKSVQVHVKVGQMQAYLLHPPQLQRRVRRPLLRCEVGGVVVAAARNAPRKIWMQLAPPNAVTTALKRNPKAFEEIAAEVGVQDVRAIFCSMPSSASTLRRLVWTHRIHARVVADPLENLAKIENNMFQHWKEEEEADRHHHSLHSAEDKVKAFVRAGVEATGHLYERYSHQSQHSQPLPERKIDREISRKIIDTGSTIFTDMTNSRCGSTEDKFFMQLRVAFMGNEIEQADEDSYGSSDKEVPHWEFAAWTLPLEVNVCHPLLKQLAQNFKPREWVPRWLGTGNDVWQTFRELRHRHDTKNVKLLKKKRKFELLCGRGGPLRGNWITGEVMVRGSMRAARFDAYSEATWLKRSCTLPKGTVKIERLVDPPRTNMAFTPSREKGGPYPSKDGWLFPTEYEALAADRIIQGGLPPVKDSTRIPGDLQPEDAGCDALEDARYQEPLFVLPEYVLKNWGVDPRDGLLRSRFRPPVSALGVKPLAPWRKSMGTKILPGCPKELICCSCSSVERNLPTALKPENCPAEWAASPCSRQCSRPSSAHGGDSYPPSARANEDRSQPLQPPSARSPAPSTSQKCGWAKAKQTLEEQSKASLSWSPFKIDSKLEAVSHETIGLPKPTTANLHIWWRSLGIMLD